MSTLPCLHEKEKERKKKKNGPKFSDELFLEPQDRRKVYGRKEETYLLANSRILVRRLDLPLPHQPDRLLSQTQRIPRHPNDLLRILRRRMRERRGQLLLLVTRRRSHLDSSRSVSTVILPNDSLVVAVPSTLVAVVLGRSRPLLSNGIVLHLHSVGFPLDDGEHGRVGS